MTPQSTSITAEANETEIENYKKNTKKIMRLKRLFKNTKNGQITDSASV